MQGIGVNTERAHPVSPGKMVVSGKMTHKYKQSVHALQRGHCKHRSAAVQLEAMQLHKCTRIQCRCTCATLLSVVIMSCETLSHFSKMKHIHTGACSHIGARSCHTNTTISFEQITLEAVFNAASKQSVEQGT